MSTTTDFARAEIIVRPADPVRLSQIRAKREIYRERMRLYDLTDSRHCDAFFKKRLLTLILRDGRVTLQAFADSVADEALFHLDLSPELISNYISGVWLVIWDYCLTGGENVSKKLPPAP